MGPDKKVSTAVPIKWTSGTLPLRVRLGVPLLCLGNIAFFILAQILPAVSTHVKGFALIKNFEVEASKDNLFSATRRLANAGAWGSVILTSVFSGLWPYLRLLGTMFFVAIADSRFMRRAWVYKGLIALELLGKLCFCDVLVLILNLLIFNITTDGPIPLKHFGHLEIRMFMNMHFASLALVISVALSAIVNHWAVIELRRLLELEEMTDGEDAERKPLLEEEGLGSMGANAHAGVGGTKLALTAASAFMMAMTSIACLIAGASVPFMKVDHGGFLGELIRPQAHQNLDISVFNTAQKLRDDGDKMYYLMSYLFLLFCFVMPVLDLVCIAVSAFGSLRGGIVSTFSGYGRFVSDACNPLACIEVLLITALAIVGEIQTIVKFNIGDSCAPFASILSNKGLLSLVGLDFAASKTCFNPQPSLQAGFWLLLSALVLRTVASRLLPSR
mmetsp:Transcript_31987/g.68115  ORF Transcript_31987/g.68115 Transcript_31987/m.68115 type:complete len:445 (+) Transcript_31987:93-1427(+)